MSYAVVGLLVSYTGLLVYLGRLGRKRSTSENFIHGGRQFSAVQVFFMISALWCSWIFVVELETAFLFGVSAVWFGVAVGIMALASVYALATPMRRLSYVTNSGLIGQRFGPVARSLAGVVIAVTFPIFAMSNVLAAAAFLHVVLGWPLLVTLLATAAVMLAYVMLGGIWALAYTQIANFVVMSVGLLIGVLVAWQAAPPHLMQAALQPRFFSPSGVGLGVILTWLFSDLLNVVSAQAEFQVLTAAKDPATARRGLYGAMVSIGAFTLLSVVIGMAARTVVGGKELGVLALPQMFMKTSPPVVVALMALAMWASALTWSAPLMFSGASSLGADVLGLVRRRALAGRVRFCVQVCLPLQAALVVLYATLRPQDLAWWSVFSLTVRNGAIFAPTVAVLLWPAATRLAAVTSIAGGALAGLAWNVASHFSTTTFLLGLNPMWVSATAGIGLLTVLTLAARADPVRLKISELSRPGGAAALSTLVVSVGLIVFARSALVGSGLLGPVILIVAVSAMAVSAQVAREKRTGAAPVAVSA